MGGEFIVHCITLLTLFKLCPPANLSQVAGATENVTRPERGVSSGPESVAEDRVLEPGSSDLTPIQTGTGTQSTGRNQKKEPKQLAGNQPWSSTISFQAAKSDASLLESDESPDFTAEATTAQGVTPEDAGAANTDVSRLDGLQNSGFNQTIVITESGFLTPSTYSPPEEGIKDEEVEASPLTITPQASAETHTMFSGQMKESSSPSKASIKALEVPPKHLNQGINEVVEDLGHGSVRRTKDKEKMNIAVDPVTLETETSSPPPLPEGEQDNKAGTDTDGLKLEEEDVDVNVWMEKGPQEKDVSIQSSFDWSPRPPTVDSVIHSKTAKATNQTPPGTAQHASKLGPGVRGQRVRPSLHLIVFCPSNCIKIVLTNKSAVVSTRLLFIIQTFKCPISAMSYHFS